MSSNEAPNNVIQFPGRKPEAEAKKPATTPATPPKATAKKPSASKKTLGATVFAVMLFSAAVNNYVFDSYSSSQDMASQGRGLASVGDSLEWKRDADWEKRLAEKLASPKVREVASAHIGRAATKEERLRWGALEEKYTITYKADRAEISGILLQDPASDPAYVLDRPKFLNEFGSLFDGGYAGAKLKSVEKSEDKTVESYTIFDKDQRPSAEARFELDRHKRLISLKVEPRNI